MKDLLKLLCERLEKNIPVVLTTIIRQEGSTPRGPGSKMLVDSKGIVSGTIGGGLAEAAVLKACAKALESKNTEVMDFNLTGEMAAQCEMICGGRLQVFVEPLLPKAETIAFYRKLAQSLDAYEAIVLTTLHKQTYISRSLYLDGHCDVDELNPKSPYKLSPALKNTLVSKLGAGQKMMHIVDGESSCIIEKYEPAWQMIIAGGGHVSLFTAKVAALAGFSVTVMDDRAEFSNPERFPHAIATHTVPEYKDCFAACNPSKHTCIVIVSRGHLHDKTILEQAILTKASYIGMIGSKRKRKQVYDTLIAQGITKEALDVVYCPVGLDINAETPEEIAISIVAECIAHRRTAWDILQR